MKPSTAVLIRCLLIGSQVAIANSMLSARADMLAGMVVSPMQCTGPITPSGEDITLYRTAQEIHPQIKTLNPAFNPDDFKDLTSRDDNASLVKRNKITSPWCNPPGIGQSSAVAYEANISYLKSLPGRCGVAGGPRVCACIACTKGGGIALCNDNTYSIQPSCQYLASYAEDIVDICPSNGVLEYLAGQEFDTDNYNVIVQAQDC